MTTTNQQPLPEDIREGYSILKKIGYDNDSITTIELWIAESIYHLRDSEVEGLKQNFKVLEWSYNGCLETIQQQAATIKELQDKIRAVEQSEQRLMMALHWAGINTGEDLNKFLDEPYKLGKESAIKELLEGLERCLTHLRSLGATNIQSQQQLLNKHKP